MVKVVDCLHLERLDVVFLCKDEKFGVEKEDVWLVILAKVSVAVAVIIILVVVVVVVVVVVIVVVIIGRRCFDERCFKDWVVTLAESLSQIFQWRPRKEIILSIPILFLHPSVICLSWGGRFPYKGRGQLPTTSRLLVQSRFSHVIGMIRSQITTVAVVVVVVVILVSANVVGSGVGPLDEAHKRLGLNIFKRSDFIHCLAHPSIDHPIERFGKTTDKVSVYV